MLALIDARPNEGIDQLKQEALNAIAEELTKPSNQDNAAIIKVALETDIDAEFKNKSLALGKIKNFSIMAFAKNVLFKKRANAQQEKQQLLQLMIDACKQPSPLAAPLTIEQIKEILPKLLRIAKQAAEYPKTVDWLNDNQDWKALAQLIVDETVSLSEKQKIAKDNGVIVELAKVANDLSTMLALGVKLDNSKDGGLDKLKQIRQNIIEASNELIKDLKATAPSTIETISQAMPLLVVAATAAQENPSVFAEGEVSGLKTLVSQVVDATVKLSTPEDGEPQEGEPPSTGSKDEKDLIKLAGVAAGLSDIAKLGDDFVSEDDKGKIQTINENINNEIKKLLAALAVKNSGELDVAQIKEAVSKLVEIANQAKDSGVLELLNGSEEWVKLVVVVVGGVLKFAKSQEAASKQGKNLDEMIVLAEVAGELGGLRGIIEDGRLDSINRIISENATILAGVKTKRLNQRLNAIFKMEKQMRSEVSSIEKSTFEKLRGLPKRAKEKVELQIQELEEKHNDTDKAVKELEATQTIKKLKDFKDEYNLQELVGEAKVLVSGIQSRYAKADLSRLQGVVDNAGNQAKKQKVNDELAKYNEENKKLQLLESKLKAMGKTDSFIKEYRTSLMKFGINIGSQKISGNKLVLFRKKQDLIASKQLELEKKRTSHKSEKK